MFRHIVEQNQPPQQQYSSENNPYHKTLKIIPSSPWIRQCTQIQNLHDLNNQIINFESLVRKKYQKNIQDLNKEIQNLKGQDSRWSNKYSNREEMIKHGSSQIKAEITFITSLQKQIHLLFQKISKAQQNITIQRKLHQKIIEERLQAKKDLINQRKRQVQAQSLLKRLQKLVNQNQQEQQKLKTHNLVNQTTKLFLCSPFVIESPKGFRNNEYRKQVDKAFQETEKIQKLKQIVGKVNEIYGKYKQNPEESHYKEKRSYSLKQIKVSAIRTLPFDRLQRGSHFSKKLRSFSDKNFKIEKKSCILMNEIERYALYDRSKQQSQNFAKLLTQYDEMVKIQKNDRIKQIFMKHLPIKDIFRIILSKGKLEGLMKIIENEKWPYLKEYSQAKYQNFKTYPQSKTLFNIKKGTLLKL